MAVRRGKGGVQVKMDLAENVLMVSGLAMMGYGLWLIWPPAMYLVIGTWLFAAGAMSYQKRKREASND